MISPGVLGRCILYLVRQCYCALEALIVPGASSREALSSMRACIESRATNSLQQKLLRCVSHRCDASQHHDSIEYHRRTEGLQRCRDDACMTLRRQLHPPSSAPIAICASGRLSCGEAQTLPSAARSEAALGSADPGVRNAVVDVH